MSVVKTNARIIVSEIVSSRYENTGELRPLSWDRRMEGIDIIKTSGGRTLKLLSDGGQSTPQKGWTILLTSGDEQNGYRWTLFGMPKGSEIHTY